MRGFLQPSVKNATTESQTTFRKLQRGRRSKLAKAAQTTLVKADQWARGGKATSDVAEALEAQLKALAKKKK
jgi:uncharacterized protein YjhX (UPF0386 family)